MGMFDDMFESGFGETQVEGVDYYMNPDGYRVMTEHYLVKRGYCCSNGCTNCPYSPKAVKGNRKLRRDVQKSTGQ
ncbi:MAG TPA: DUF5522 domain-containing protein [Prolixibacteraceae bacterium]|nr:DUF5522 domain-containing protein [Prolixibacteraceae bacterium]